VEDELDDYEDDYDDEEPIAASTPAAPTAPTAPTASPPATPPATPTVFRRASSSSATADSIEFVRNDYDITACCDYEPVLWKCF